MLTNFEACLNLLLYIGLSTKYLMSWRKIKKYKPCHCIKSNMYRYIEILNFNTVGVRLLDIQLVLNLVSCSRISTHSRFLVMISSKITIICFFSQTNKKYHDLHIFIHSAILIHYFTCKKAPPVLLKPIFVCLFIISYDLMCMLMGKMTGLNSRLKKFKL